MRDLPMSGLKVLAWHSCTGVCRVHSLPHMQHHGQPTINLDVNLPMAVVWAGSNYLCALTERLVAVVHGSRFTQPTYRCIACRLSVTLCCVTKLCRVAAMGTQD